MQAYLNIGYAINLMDVPKELHVEIMKSNLFEQHEFFEDGFVFESDIDKDNYEPDTSMFFINTKFLDSDICPFGTWSLSFDKIQKYESETKEHFEKLMKQDEFKKYKPYIKLCVSTYVC